MDRQARTDEAARLKHTAILVVQQHAARYAPDVAPAMVEAICAALGELSVADACVELNRLQGEAMQ